MLVCLVLCSSIELSLLKYKRAVYAKINGQVELAPYLKEKPLKWG
tara:strand:+ start:1096 stop:1230 length:135 start_codon:yes stop_codon:yes gene_type:complete